MNRTLITLEPAIKNKQLRYSFNHQEKKLSVCSDEDRVIQVLTNVISNAIKYSKKGGAIDVFVDNLPDLIEIIVSDQGRGIKKEDLDKVFDKFNSLQQFQYDPKSTGFGMYLSKTIVQILGGTIGIDSQFGKGTTVHFTLAKRPIPNPQI